MISPSLSNPPLQGDLLRDASLHQDRHSGTGAGPGRLLDHLLDGRRRLAVVDQRHLVVSNTCLKFGLVSHFDVVT